MRHSGLCHRKLATLIAEAYMAQVAPSERIVEFHTGTTLEAMNKAERANAQLVDRFMRGVVKLPADLEEAWVSALPDPWGTDCARELARRYGFLAARAPTAGESAAVSLADMAREFGETVAALAPIMADGTVDERDQPYLRQALKETNDLMAELVRMQRRLADALPEGTGCANVTEIRRA